MAHQKGSSGRRRLAVGRRRSVLAVASTVALAATVALPQTAHAASSYPASFLALPDSATLLSAPIVASGLAPEHSTVVLYVEPPTTALRTAHLGQRFLVPALTRASADGAGRWSLRLPETSAVVARENLGGVVNLEAIVLGSTSDRVSFFSAKVGVAADHALTQWASTANARSSSPDSPALINSPDLVTYKDRELGNKLDVVGETFSTDSKVTAGFVYTRGASSSIEVGYSAKSDLVGFVGSGTSATSSSGSLTYPSYGGSRNMYYKTTFDYGVWTDLSPTGHGGQSVGYESVNEGWDAGSAVTQVATAPYNAEKCVLEVAGAKLEFDRSNAITWSNGLNIGNDLGGLQLSSETCYSTSAATTYKWGSDANNRLCGYHNYPDLPGSLINLAR